MKRTHNFSVSAIGLLCGILFLSAGAHATLMALPVGKLKAFQTESPDPQDNRIHLAYFSPNFEPEDYRDRPPYLAPKGTTLISRGKRVTSSQENPLKGEFKQITDGDKSHEKKSLVELEGGMQWIQIDLGEAYMIYAILVWHRHDGKRVYFDVVAKISDDSEFQNAVTVYNNDFDGESGQGKGKDKEYAENNKGRLIPVQDGTKGRYVRLYSHGCTDSRYNHYVEVEVFGKPAADKDDGEREPIQIELPEPFFGGVPL